MALTLRKEEGLGLGIAIAAHAALVAVLLLRPQSAPVVTPPERIEVTISDDVGLTSTSPEPASQAAAPVAPSLGEPQPQEEAEPAPPEPEPAPPEPAPPPPKPAPPKPTPPKPAPAKPTPAKPTPPKPAPAKPTPRPVPKPAPRPSPRPEPAKPVAKPTPPKRTTPKPPASATPQKATPRPAAPAQRTPSKAPAKTPAKQAATRSPPAKAPSRAPAGGSRIGSDFLAGVSGASSNNRAAANAPAATIGPAVKASLASAISRALKPRWQAPQGPDAEEIVTILSFNLNRDGTLNGAPTVVRQLGITDVNRNQAERHAEQAVKAVRLAAPFDLPEEYYDAWKRVSAFRFDKRLSQ